MLIKIILKTIFFYFINIFTFKIFKKKNLTELTINDFLVIILFIFISSYGIINNINLLEIILSLTSIIILSMSFNYLSIKDNNIKEFFIGTPKILINKGKINFKEMLKQRYSIDTLLTSLREKNFKDIKSVDYAILEPNGKLSVFDKTNNKNTFPLAIILDGKVDYEALDMINKDRVWLNNNIEVDIEDIFYAFYNNDTLYVIKKSTT